MDDSVESKALKQIQALASEAEERAKDCLQTDALLYQRAFFKALLNLHGQLEVLKCDLPPAVYRQGQKCIDEVQVGMRVAFGRQRMSVASRELLQLVRFLNETVRD